MSVIRGCTFFSKEVGNITIGREPNECPRCHHAIDPRFVAAVATTLDRVRVQANYQCPRTECRELFIGYYTQRNSGSAYILQRVAPINHLPQVFPAEVASISQNFVAVYNQAIAAEQSALDQIAGMGLRKSVEFLIKDFAIYTNPNKAEEIKKTPLAKCIKAYISDPNVQRTATRATWLGNDETHYVRRWEEQDISDLKLLIKLTVNWIENVLLTEKYEHEMPA